MSDRIGERIEQEIEDAAHTLLSGASRVLVLAALIAWLGLWGLVGVIGLVFDLPTVATVGASAMGCTLIAWLARRVVKKRRLEGRARRELVARCALEGLRIDRELEGALRAFDLSYRRASEILESDSRIEEDLAVSAAVDLEHLRDHVFRLAREKCDLTRDLKGLGRPSRVAAVSTALEELRAQIRVRQGEAERIANDVHQLAVRLREVRALAPSAAGEESSGELSRIFEELDRTAAAYREIEEAEDEVARRLRARRASRERE